MQKFLNVVGRFLTPLEVKDHISNSHVNRIARAPVAPPLFLHLNPAMAMLSALKAVFVQEETILAQAILAQVCNVSAQSADCYGSPFRHHQDDEGVGHHTHR